VLRKISKKITLTLSLTSSEFLSINFKIHISKHKRSERKSKIKTVRTTIIGKRRCKRFNINRNKLTKKLYFKYWKSAQTSLNRADGYWKAINLPGKNLAIKYWPNAL
jgi:hypothetical protein